MYGVSPYYNLLTHIFIYKSMCPRYIPLYAYNEVDKRSPGKQTALQTAPRQTMWRLAYVRDPCAHTRKHGGGVLIDTHNAAPVCAPVAR